MIFKKTLPKEIHRAYGFDFTTGVLNGLALGLTTPFLAVVARRLGASAGYLAVLVCAPYIGSLLSFYWAHLAERYGRKRCVILGGVVSMSLLLFAVFKLTPFWYCTLIFFSQFMLYMGRPAYTGIMAQIYPDSARGKAMGYVRIGISSATTFASFLGGRLLDIFSYRVVYPIAGALGVLANFAFSKICVPSPKDDNDIREFTPPFPTKLQNKREGRAGFRLKEAFEILKNDATYRKFEQGFFIFGFGNLMALPVYALFVVDVLKLTNFEVGFLATVASLLGIGAMYYWGHAIDAKGAFRLAGKVILLLSLTPFVYCIAGNYWILFIAAAASGIGLAGLELITMNSIIEISKKVNVPKYTGIHITLMGIRGSIAPFAGTQLAAIIGLRWVFFLSGALIVLGGMLVMREFYRRS
ncbi:MAG: MFS transporter [Candidatus Omnitrophota bacterium]